MAAPRRSIQLANVRIAFAERIFVPDRVNKNDATAPKKFSATFLFPPNDPAVNTVTDAIRAVAQEKWPTNHTELLKQMQLTQRLCMRSGDTKADLEGFAGNVFVSASSSNRPVVVDRQRNPVTLEDGLIFSGCYVNAALSVWAQDNEHGKRVNAGLDAVQFVKIGEAFGGSAPVDPNAVFADLGSDPDASGSLTGFAAAEPSAATSAMRGPDEDDGNSML